MVRGSTGLDPNQAGRQLLKECEDITTLQLPTDNYLAASIYAMDLKNRLRNVETDCNRLHGLAPPNRGSFNSTHVYGTRVPVEEPSTASKTDIAAQPIDRELIHQP